MMSQSACSIRFRMRGRLSFFAGFTSICTPVILRVAICCVLHGLIGSACPNRSTEKRGRAPGRGMRRGTPIRYAGPFGHVVSKRGATGFEGFSAMVRAAFAAAAAALCGFGVFADEVVLTNGDRLTGHAVALDAEALSFQTDYAGELRIVRGSIESIQTDEPRAWLDVSGGENAGPLNIVRTQQGDPPPEGAVPLSAVSAFAEDHAALDPPPAEPAPKHWSGTVNLGGTYRTGNTDKVDVVLSTEWKRTAETNRLTLRAGWAYGASNDILNTRKLSADGRWEYDLTDRIYLYTLGGAEKDDGRQLDLRANAALGLGYQFWDEETRKLSIDLGAEFTHEEWAPFTPWAREGAKASSRRAAFDRGTNLLVDLASGRLVFDRDYRRALLSAYRDFRDPLRAYDTRTENYLTARAGTNYEQQIFERGKITDAAVLSANLEDTGEFRFKNELAFTTPLSEQLSLKIALLSEYDSMAENFGVEAWDHTLTTGLAYSF
ncbi:MAG: DUF481 domain-containing protein [Candidatus Hydrogenedens sp.]|nr:DUF481 domain-containing protein [Candidatus Hydrogenedens sp.]